ncbi:MAG: TraR/DksA family transcriptional regulator [Thermoanaerobaculia bacterium]
MANAQVNKAQDKKLERSREALLDHRKEILDLLQNDRKAGQEAGSQDVDDIVDRANSSYSREFLFSLTGGESEQLKLIEDALSRIEEGTYGVCLNCGQSIGEPRLKAVPWARYCVDCQEKAEQGLFSDSD